MTRRTLPGSFETMCERFGVRANSALLIRELKSKRTERQDQARQIMTRSGANMNTAEQREFDRLMDEYENLDEMVTQAEERTEGDRSAVDEDRPNGRRDTPNLYFHTADGRKVRAVRHGESFARAAGTPRTAGSDPEDLSLGRALVGILRGDHAMMEREMRAQVVAQDPAGGFFVTPTLGNLFIDLARSQSVISQAGAMTIPLGSGETRILRTATDPTASWKAELGALNNTDVQFDAVTLYPKVLGCIADISEELIEDGANAAAQIEAVLSAAVANQLDRSFWRGVSNGTGDNDVAGRYFTGILDDPGVGTVDLAGAAPADYDEWIDAMQLVEDANGMPDVRIDSPRTAAQLAKLKEATTLAYLKAPEQVAALRHFKTTQTPVTLGAGNDESVSVVGNFASAFVIIGIRSAFRVEVSNQAGNAFENLGRKVRVWGRADMAIGRPAHLALVQAIGPTP
ncbi:phage major capsid protein [Streptomyces dysideae]|uniref:Phage capsid-like C-terminal domain-containing protein n=1 Tax=Streptomyces dysideae TaxID=909626 RepID=A0A101UZE9_9ACTN|nr:phage major capsid protein [Streptomyces dysideae]KUO19666.1 hypothetical protein AQJ91_17725 [Streptomyces dysideae]